MRIRHAATAAAALLALSACTNASTDTDTDTKAKPEASAAPTTAAPADAHRYETAQDIVDALRAAGLSPSKPKEDTSTSYITEIGGTAYDLTVAEAGKTPVGSTGINLFPNPEALAAWVPLSKQYGGIAVTADTWAVSLPTKSKAARAASESLAPKVAEALDGTVQQ